MMHYAGPQYTYNHLDVQYAEKFGDIEIKIKMAGFGCSSVNAISVHSGKAEMAWCKLYIGTMLAFSFMNFWT